MIATTEARYETVENSVNLETIAQACIPIHAVARRITNQIKTFLIIEKTTSQAMIRIYVIIVYTLMEIRPPKAICIHYECQQNTVP